MNISDAKALLEEIVHNTLYVSSKESKKQKDNLKKIRDFLKKSDNVIEDIRTIVSTRNNENYFAYDKYITMFLTDCKLDVKLNILSEFLRYEDIIKDNKIFMDIWNSINSKDKINYLLNKKKLNYLDISFINNDVSDINEVSPLLKEIINNRELRNKIDPYTINVTYSKELMDIIDLSDFNKCNILTKESYTKLLLKHIGTFKEFKELFKKNRKIYNLILNNSLIFNDSDNKDIYEFILENPNFIGKFTSKYLDLFSIVEITDISKIKTLDNDAFSAIIQKLYKYDKDKASLYFSLDNLKKCSKHSIIVYPFNHLDKDLQDSIFNTYTLFNRFIDTIMIEAINNSFQEVDIVNILRNDVFINDMSPYAIELLLNKLSFKSAFNMLQRKIIFNKINNLNVKVSETDGIFIKGFLDSPILVFKSEHNMIYEMLSMLDSEDVLYYISLPYVAEELSNYELIKLILNKDIKLSKVIETDSLRETLNLTDLINLIDESFSKCIDLNIFRHKELCKGLFNINDKIYEKINFDEVNYLFETIRMKGLLSKQESKVTVLSYKSVLVSYLVFGLEGTISLINNGNKGVTLEEILKLKEEVVTEKLLMFKENNSSIFQNMAKKLIKNLLEIESVSDINDFQVKIRKDTYIDNIIYLMLDNNFDSYNNIIDKLYGFRKYFTYDEFLSKKEIYNYTQEFINLYLNNKLEEYNNEFENIILKNFKVTESVIYNKRKEIGRDFLNDLKFKLFVRALTDPSKDMYVPYFEPNYPIYDIKEKYIKHLASEGVDFDSILEHVLTPIINNRFDKENCLNKLGIKKPKNTDLYLKYLRDLKNVTTLNVKLDKIKEDYTGSDLLSIMNFICYNSPLIFNSNSKLDKKLLKLQRLTYDLDGELYVDKSVFKFIYKDNLDIYNIDEIIEYNNYMEILNDIIKKTKGYINKHMNTEAVKNSYAHDYFKAINTDDCRFPITSKYYEPIKRVFTLHDLETIFSGYDLSSYKPLSDSLKEFLFDKKNLIMVADGYYKDIVTNLGIIISKWDKIISYTKKIELDINELTLISIENVLIVMNFSTNTLGKNIESSIFKDICKDGYYEVNDINKRINILVDLYKNSFKVVNKSIPYLCYKDDVYKVEILDSYNQDIFKCLGNSLYKVGAIGNDFLHYSILNKNGLQIGIYKEDVLVSKILGIRNGNTVYLNALEGMYDSNYNELLRLFATQLINITKDSIEPIEFVTIVNNDIYKSRNGLKLDTTMCPNINSPINKVYNDYETFMKYPNLLNGDDIYTNYEDNISTLLASSNIVDKDNFKYYDSDACYYRRRNNVIKLSNNIGEDYLNKIDTILYLCKLEDSSINVDNIILSNIDTIYLGDDYVVFVTENNSIENFVLPYDERAKREIDMLIESIKKTNE